MKAIWVGLFVLVAGAALAETNALCGSWTTGPVLSQLGMVLTTKDFKTNGTVATTVHFLSVSNVIPLVVTGAYSVVGNKLVTVIRGETSEIPFVFEGGTLVLTENKTVKVRLKRK